MPNPKTKNKMNNRIRYFFTIVVLMVAIVSRINAVVVFESNFYGNNQITEDGITISTSNSGDLSIASSNGNIVMIGFQYAYRKWVPGEESNTGLYTSDNIVKQRIKKQTKEINHHPLMVSTGFIENCGDYRVWTGQSKNITIENVYENSEEDDFYLEKIYVYLEGDDLPLKMPYVTYYNYEDYWYGHDKYSSLTFNYGYKQFVSPYDSYEVDYGPSVVKICYSIKEDGSYQEWKGKSVNNISFSLAFKDYQPTNTSNWFNNVRCEDIVDFCNLNLSKTTDLSYMFKGSNIQFIDMDISKCKNINYMFNGYSGKKIDISSLSFSNHPVSTETFTNSSIIYMTVSSSINEARNDLFNGLGTLDKPCYLITNGDIDLGSNNIDGVFQWKLGYFIFPQNEAYVVHKSEYHTEWRASEDQYYYNDYYEFHYDYDKDYYLSVKGHNLNYDYDDETSFKGIAGVYSLENEAGIQEWIEDFNNLFSYIRERQNSYDYLYHYNIEVNIMSSFDGYSSTSHWFDGFQGENINGLNLLETTSITNMSYMFADCSNLSNLDISNFDTSNVTDMSSMFAGCTNLSILDVTNFDTSKVTDMSWLFSECGKLTSLNISNFDTSNVTDMTGMLSWLNITSLDLSQFNTSNVRNMSGLFWNSNKLKTLDLSNFDTSNVTDMSNMFSEDFGNLALLYLDVSSFNTSKVTDMSGMFVGCGNLTSLNVSNFDTSSVTNMESMFGNCSKLTSLDVSNFNTSNVTDMSQMFSCCSNLTSLDVSNFDTSNLVEEQWSGSYEMFSDCSSLQELSVSSTMANIQENACQRVGSKNSPCTIYAPKGFDFGTDTSQPYFIWKSGFFVKGADIITYAVGDIITYQGLLYQVTKFGDDGNEVTLIKNPDAQGEIIIPSNIMDESGTVGFTVTAIEDYAFYNCANITKLSIPATVRSIGIAITSCCTILNDITVAEDNPYYDSRDNCNAVINTATGELLAGCNKTTIPEGVTAIGTEAMRGMFDLEGIILPSTLTRIGNRAFYYCKKLTGHLAIPEGVTEIETYAFYKCTGLTAISLPSTITTMGSCAFRECTNVTWVSCYADTPPSIDSRMFGKFAGCTLMVPIGSVDTYKAATNWKKFDPIIRESVVSVEDVAILNNNKGTARISLDNGTNVYTGCQFNITLPEGTDLVKQTHGGYEYTISNRFSGTPSVQITPQDDGSYMILIYSMNNTTINGSEGELISLPIKANTDLSIGSYPGTITNVTFNNPDNTSAYLHDVTFNITVPSFVLGDVNHDRTVNITDVMMTVNHVVGQTPAGFHVENADVNGDHVINITDVIVIVNYILGRTNDNFIFTNSDLDKNGAIEITDPIPGQPSAEQFRLCPALGRQGIDGIVGLCVADEQDTHGGDTFLHFRSVSFYRCFP